MSEPQFGLRYFRDGAEIRLSQIAGDGRLLLLDMGTGKKFWTKTPEADWQVYDATDGQTYPSHEAAALVGQNLWSRTRIGQ